MLLLVRLVVPVTATAVAVLLARVTSATSARALAGVPVAADEALVALSAGLALALLLWLALGVALEVLALLPGRVGRGSARLSAWLSPRLVRQVAALVIGVGVTTGAAGVAQAAPVRATVETVAESLVPGGRPAPGPGWLAAPTGTLPSEAPDPGWTPSAPVVRSQPDLAPLGARSTGPTGEVVVRRGDSLWAIAGRHLGDDASDAEIAREWPRWYAANRDVIGPDPDRLLPGQVLGAPVEVLS